jgi:hypothetical protein
MFASALAAALMVSVGYAAQQTPTAPAAPDKQETTAPAGPNIRTGGLWINVKIELTITDQAGPGETAKRTVSMIVSDRQKGSIRSQGQVVTAGRQALATLNVDATPLIIKDSQLRLDIGLEYVPKPVTENATSGEGRGSLNERLILLVESGKPLVISQASDPTSDRKISVELTATILK